MQNLFSEPVLLLVSRAFCYIKTVIKSDTYILAGVLLFTTNVDCSTPAFSGYTWQNAVFLDKRSAKLFSFVGAIQ